MGRAHGLQNKRGWEEAHKGESCDVATKRGEMEDSCDAGSLLLVGSDIMFLSPHGSADCVGVFC